MTRWLSCADTEGEILLVEDNPGDARLTRELLADAGLTNSIHVATGGQEALDFVHQRDEFAEKSRPDVILLDWHLSRVDGEWVLRRLDDDPELRRIPVVVLTGTRMESGSIVPSDLEVEGYLTKPIDPDEFCSLVESFDDFSLTACCSAE